MFENTKYNIEKITDKLYNISIDDIKFSFIELKLVGSPVMLDESLALGVSKCKNLLFIGSVGSLNENIKIGDIVVPKYSIIGTGATRYLCENLEDDFGKKVYPNNEITTKLLSILKKSKEKIAYHYVPNFSVDTIFAQFYHIDLIKKYKVDTIEMETSALFKAAEITGIKATAILIVSDNTTVNKSLYSGRTKEDKEYKNNVKYNILPKIICELFDKIKVTEANN